MIWAEEEVSEGDCKAVVRELEGESGENSVSEFKTVSEYPLKEAND